MECWWLFHTHTQKKKNLKFGAPVLQGAYMRMMSKNSESSLRRPATTLCFSCRAALY